MPTAITAFCRRTGQTAPTDHGAFTRMILESLALKYRSVKNGLVQVTGQPVDKIHVIGGGCQHDLLNQFTADALNCTVVAGPIEATSIGNIIMQLHALGELRSLAEGRALVRRSFQTRVYTPRNPDAWVEAETRFKRRLSS
jgi:sugar (pentulose or hexulose) kinase